MKSKTSTDWSLCPYTKMWCFGRKVGDVEKCKLCEVQLKFKNEIERRNKNVVRYK